MKGSLIAGASVGLLVGVLDAAGAPVRVQSIAIVLACAILMVSSIRRSRADRHGRQG